MTAKTLIPPASAAENGHESRPERIPRIPLEPGEQYRFHFDMNKCVGCHCCDVACSEQNNNPPDVSWRRVGEVEGGAYPHTLRSYVSMGCNHCLEPACLTGCPVDAYEKEGNGIVLHKDDVCIGCQYCTWNCPYGVPQYNPERKIVTKCDMCHSRLSAGQEPACVAACPSGAIEIETVNAERWKRDPMAGDAPGIPQVEGTLSTTRFTLPDSLPDSSVTTSYYQIKPEDAHPSLIFLTLLTQISVGGFLTFWLIDLFSQGSFFPQAAHRSLAIGAVASLLAGLIAMGASVFHLGRPMYAFRALKMWRRSWLSREILFFTLFAAAAIAT
ncbi:MAG: DmsC/YnfH family molybdoenzyme membrane anchor subunit, partial [Nitrospinales bacterium]